MIIKLNRTVRQLCLSLARQYPTVPAILCRTGKPPCCTTTGNVLVLTIARRDCPSTFWRPETRKPCGDQAVSPCGCIQDIVGVGYRPAIELAVPGACRCDTGTKPVVIQYDVAECAPNGALCFRLDHLLFDQRDGRYRAIVTNGVDCMWNGQIELGNGPMRLTGYTTQAGSPRAC